MKKLFLMMVFGMTLGLGATACGDDPCDACSGELNTACNAARDVCNSFNADGDACAEEFANASCQ